MGRQDVLEVIPDEDLPKLKEIYRKVLPHRTHVYNYLSTVIEWKKNHPNSNHYTIMAPNGDWKNGTFIGINEYSCYELLVSTLENNCQTLCDALMETKKINWKNKAFFYALPYEFFSDIMKVLDSLQIQTADTHPCGVWRIPKNEAKAFEINLPPEVYVAKLEKIHVPIINLYWPHRSEGSDKYVENLIEMFGGYGLFLKSNNELVSWVIQTTMGLGLLQTAEEHKQKGYGSLITKVLSKSFAETGYDPIGTVLENNYGSKSMFGKLGFENLELVIYIFSI